MAQLGQLGLLPRRPLAHDYCVDPLGRVSSDDRRKLRLEASYPLSFLLLRHSRSHLLLRGLLRLLPLLPKCGSLPVSDASRLSYREHCHHLDSLRVKLLARYGCHIHIAVTC